MEIKVFSDQGKEVPEGEEGELCVKGDHVCHSYWNTTEAIFRNDFNGIYFKTGDWGYIRNGYVYLKSRKKEMINVGGKKVSPIEVEEVLNQIGGVEESVCVGMADPGNVLGEVVKAFVTKIYRILRYAHMCSQNSKIIRYRFVLKESKKFLKLLPEKFSVYY